MAAEAFTTWLMTVDEARSCTSSLAPRCAPHDVQVSRDRAYYDRIVKALEPVGIIRPRELVGVNIAAMLTMLDLQFGEQGVVSRAQELATAESKRSASVPTSSDKTDSVDALLRALKPEQPSKVGHSPDRVTE